MEEREEDGKPYFGLGRLENPNSPHPACARAMCYVCHTIMLQYVDDLGADRSRSDQATAVRTYMLHDATYLDHQLRLVRQVQ